MTIDFYYTPGSSPCRSVLLTAKYLNIDLNLKLVDLHHGEHLKPEYLKVSFIHISNISRPKVRGIHCPNKVIVIPSYSAAVVDGM